MSDEQQQSLASDVCLEAWTILQSIMLTPKPLQKNSIGILGDFRETIEPQ